MTMKNAATQINRSGAEEIRARILMNGGHSLWAATHNPRGQDFGNVQIVDAYSYGGRVVIVHEFYNTRIDTRSAVDVYVPLTEGIRMDDTLAAIDALKKEE